MRSWVLNRAVADMGFYFKVKPMVQVYVRLTAYGSSCLYPIVYLYYYLRE